MKSLKKALLATLLVAGITVAAHAQAPTVPTAKATKPIAIKLGVILPSGDAKDIFGSAAFYVGATYDLGKTKMESPVLYGPYIDAAFGSKSQSIGSVSVKGEGSFVGVGGQARYLFTPPTSAVHFYGGAGLGVYFDHVKGRISVAGEGGSESKNKTTLGGKVFVGAEFAQGFLGELMYHFPGSVEGVNLNTFGLAVGYRF